jgi:hypothetical protein
LSEAKSGFRQAMAQVGPAIEKIEGYYTVFLRIMDSISFISKGAT